MKYIQVVRWSAKGDGILLEMLGEDQQIHGFEIGAECIGVLAAALVSESEKRSGEDRDRQFIRPTGMEVGKTDQGEPVVLMSLKGGAELPLVFKPESLSVLISQLEGLVRAVQPESKIRWN